MPTAMNFGPRYRCLREIGHGGGGRVFLVRDKHLESDVALKLLHRRPAGERLRRFREEFSLLSRLEHPGVARAFDFGYVGKRPFFTSDFVAGQSLDRTQVPAAPVDALASLRRVAGTLAFLHGRGVLHLDIKPSNIILRAGSPTPDPILIDFGLFRTQMDRRPKKALEGTLPFMAPEYFRGEALGPWTDVYALGVTLYWLTTGGLPRHFPENISSWRDLTWDPAPSAPSRLVSGMNQELDDIVLKCIALDPAERFNTADAFAAALGGLPEPRPRSVVLAGAIERTIGRERELAKIVNFLRPPPQTLRDDAGAQGRVALVLTGPEGIGQSHLLREAKVLAQTAGSHFYLETGYGGQPTLPGALFRCLGNHLGDADPDVDSREGDREEAVSGEPRPGGPRARWSAFLARLSRPRLSPRQEVLDGERRLRRSYEISAALRKIRDPLVLAVDGLQHFDEISVELLLLLLRCLDDIPPNQRADVRIIVGLREEGTGPGRWDELVDYLLQSNNVEWLTLHPLDVDATLEMTRIVHGGGVERREALRLFQETRGRPGKILTRALETSSRHSASAAAMPAGLQAENHSKTLAPAARRMLLLLELLDRPASRPELARLLGQGLPPCLRLLEKLEEKRLVSRQISGASRTLWVIETTGAAASRAGTTLAERRTLHRRLGLELARKARDAGDPRLLQGVRHLQAASCKRELVTHGLRAARFLRSTHQNRAALELFLAVREVLPAMRSATRLDVAIELSELHARLGEFDQGIQLLRETLEETVGVTASSRARLLLRLAKLYSGRGDFRRAASHFKTLFKGHLGTSRTTTPEIPLEERLFFLNEFAAVQAVLGEHDSAASLCEFGLRLAASRRSHSVREVMLNLYATRANIAMRSFDHASAVNDFERALALAERIGSPVNQAVVLNNLGVAHLNSDRYDEAIRSFRDAERISARLDEGPSLVSTFGNLAVLYAKKGQFEEMDQVLRQAAELTPSAMGRRQQGFLEHARGLCLISRGRHAEARKHLEISVALGKETGDELLVAFDEAYRAEALVFEGLYAQAQTALRNLTESRVPVRVRRMAWARLAFSAALRANPEEVAKATSSYEALDEPRSVPFLEAWDRLFLWWAASTCRKDHSPPEEMRDFFTRHALAPARSLALWIEAEGAFLDGNTEKAQRLVDSAPASGNDLTDMLWKLLRARLTLEKAETTVAIGHAGDLLANAAALLVGNPQPEWHARIEALRDLLRPRPRADSARNDEVRTALRDQLPPTERQRYLESEHWQRWVKCLEEKSFAVRGGATVVGEGNLPRTTHALAEEDRPPPTPGGLVLRSRAMRALAAQVSKFRDSELPVLIEGETGSGKEAVARWVHAESPRANRPFFVIDCPTLPAELFEAEIFGARAGAFTDLREDQLGILSRVEGGTVLLDEIAELPLGVQGKLLRVLGTGCFRALGSEEEVRTNVRFLFSTSANVDEEKSAGNFRADFLHRIRVLPIRVPPLRERPEDLEGLVALFLEETAPSRPSVDPEVLERLRYRPWPGNVRELRNLVARLVVESPQHITLESLARVLGGVDTQTVFPKNLLVAPSLPRLKDQLERDYLRHHLQRFAGDTQALSDFLGVSRQQLYRRLRRLGVRLRGQREG